MLSADGNKPTEKPGQRKRKGEGKKAAAQKRKTPQAAAQDQDLKPDQLQDAREAISATVTSTEDAVIVTAPGESSPLTVETAIEPVASIEESPVETLAVDSPYAVPETDSAAVISPEVSSTGLAAIDWTPAASPEAAPAPSTEPAPIPAREVVTSAPAETAAVSYQTIANAYGDITRRSFDQTTSFFEKFWGVRSFDKAFELQTEFAKQAYDSFVAEAQKIHDLHRELAKQRLQRWEGFVGMSKPR
jgi:Phasin protein